MIFYINPNVTYFELFKIEFLFKNVMKCVIMMRMKRLILVSVFLLAILAMCAVSAADDTSADNLTVEEIDNTVSIDESVDNETIESGTDEPVLSEKKDSRMTVNTSIDKNDEIIDEIVVTDYDAENTYFHVKFPQKVNGTLSLYIDNNYMSNKTITAKNHYFSMYSKDYNLTYNKHTWEIKYSGDDSYAPKSVNGSFQLLPYDVSEVGIVYGTTELLEIFINEGTGNVIATIDDKKYSAPIIRGVATITLPSLSMGYHNLHIDYAGDKNLAAFSLDRAVEVYGYPTEVWNTAYNSKDATISLQLPSNAKGNLQVKVNDEEIKNVPLVNGFASVSLSDYKELGKEYWIDAKYTGSDYKILEFGEFLYSEPIVKVDTELIKGKEYTLTFELPSTYSGNLTVIVPGSYFLESDHPINTKVVNGKASVKFIANKSGPINMEYEDSKGNYFYPEAYIFVGQDPNMSASVESKAGENPVFKVNVAKDAGGAITVLINGKKYSSSYFTGSGSLTIPGLADGTYTAVVIYSGDDNYISTSKTLTFTKASKKVSKPNKITLTLKKVKVKKSAKKLILTATLKINGKAVKGKWIKFKFNKKAIKAKTNKKGIAKVTIKKNVLKKLKVGKKVKYQASYGKKVAKRTAKVKR